jgi:hypothetical protein
MFVDENGNEVVGSQGDDPCKPTWQKKLEARGEWQKTKEAWPSIDNAPTKRSGDLVDFVGRYFVYRPTSLKGLQDVLADEMDRLKNHFDCDPVKRAVAVAMLSRTLKDVMVERENRKILGQKLKKLEALVNGDLPGLPIKSEPQ